MQMNFCDRDYRFPADSGTVVEVRQEEETFGGDRC